MPKHRPIPDRRMRTNCRWSDSHRNIEGRAKFWSVGPSQGPNRTAATYHRRESDWRTRESLDIHAIEGVINAYLPAHLGWASTDCLAHIESSAA